jgi:HTH-type transcriptional regulator / antitoxin HipB
VKTTKYKYRYSGMKENIQNIVRRHRRARGLSQPQLARLAGVGKTVVFDIEHGKPTVQLDTLLKVLNALDISMVFECPEIALTEPTQQHKGQPVEAPRLWEIDTLPAHLL